MVDWHDVAAQAAADAAEVDNGSLYFGIDLDGHIGSELYTDGTQLPPSVYWVRCGRRHTIDDLAADLASWAAGRTGP